MADKKVPSGVEDFLKNIRRKSVRQLVKEDRASFEKKEEAPKEELPKEEPVTEAPKEEVKVEKPVEEKVPEAPKEEAKPEVNPEEIITKTAKEVAKEIRAIDRDKELTQAEKDKKKEELKAHWSGVDAKTGEPTPKNYDEIVAESRRLAFEDFKDFYEKQKTSELEELKKVQAEEEEKKKTTEKAYQDNVNALNAKINSEMEELYQAGKLRKPANPNDLNDPAAQEVKNLFDQAVAENERRKANGQPLIDSISKFYFLYYKPTESKQPAGEEAPIAGNRVVPAENPEKFNYVRDIHNKSFRQIMLEARRKLTGR